MIQSLRDILSFRGGNELGERGIAISGTAAALIAAALGVFGISAASTMDWTYIMATMIFVVLAIFGIGAVWFDVDFKYVLIVTVLSLAIVFLLEIGPLAAAGLTVVAGTFYIFQPGALGGRKMLIFIVLVGVGMLAVFAGEMLGITPQIEEGLQAVSP